MSEALRSIILISGTLVLSQLSPGPDVFYVFRTALAQGFRRGISVALGINIGFLLQSIFVCTAGAWAMENGWGRYIQPIAGGWLLYLAWKIFPRHWAQQNDELGGAAVEQESILLLIGKGFLCNILNPKCMLFILGLTTDGLHRYAGMQWYVPTLIVALFCSSLAGWTLWSGLLQWVPIRRFYIRHVQLIDAVFALILCIFAILLLIE